MGLMGLAPSSGSRNRRKTFRTNIGKIIYRNRYIEYKLCPCFLV
jgi:hypothetical protein